MEDGVFSLSLRSLEDGFFSLPLRFPSRGLSGLFDGFSGILSCACFPCFLCFSSFSSDDRSTADKSGSFSGPLVVLLLGSDDGTAGFPGSGGIMGSPFLLLFKIRFICLLWVRERGLIQVLYVRVRGTQGEVRYKKTYIEVMFSG